MAAKIHKRTCNICEAMCGLIITHDEHSVLSIKPDADDPLSQGFICPKAVALQDFRTDPDRITRPRLKENGQWRDIGWDEAFEVAATRLRAVQEVHGQDAVGLYLGNPNAHKFGNLMAIQSLIRALGTQNRYSSATADQIPHHVASIHMMGHPILIPIPDIDRTDMMLIIGGNPLVSNGSMMTAPGYGRRLDALKARGGRAVVIDPRRTETAERVGEHLFIRPETDAFLLLAMIREILTGQGGDFGHLEPLVEEMEVLTQAVAPFTAELAETRTGIPAETVRDLARDFAAAKSAVCYARMGASTQSFGSLCQWASNVLNIITGNFDAVGGAMFTTPALDYVAMTSRKGRQRTYPEKQSRVSGLPLYNGEFPISVMAEEIETPGEGQIKAMITIAGNPVLTAPNGRRIGTALEGLDFMVAVDIHHNATTQHADLILPGTVALEESVYDMVFHTFAVRNTAAYARAVFDPPHGNPVESEVIRRLAAVLSGGDLAPDPESVLAMLLANGPHADRVSVESLLDNPGSIDLGPMQPNVAERLETPDGKLHLAPQVFLDDLPRLLGFTPAADPERPFVMIGRRQTRSHNSWTQNSARLVKGRNRCTVQLHPEDAARLGVEEAAIVEVSGRTGAITLPAEITASMAPGVVSIPQGWGQSGDMQVAANVGSVSINDITDDARVDPISGNAAFNGVPVALRVLA